MSDQTVQVTKSCMCPTNSDDIYANKILNTDTVRCKKKPVGLLYCPEHKIHHWPICVKHMPFFALTGINSVEISGKYSLFNPFGKK